MWMSIDLEVPCINQHSIGHVKNSLGDLSPGLSPVQMYMYTWWGYYGLVVVLPQMFSDI